MGSSPILFVCRLNSILKTIPRLTEITPIDADWLLAWTETERINKDKSFNTELTVCSSLFKTTRKAVC